MRNITLTIIISWLAVMMCLTAPALTQVQDMHGVYTEAQAVRGKEIYRTQCVACHGSRLDDGTAPPLAGPQFVHDWGREGRSLDDFLYIMRTSMTRLRVSLSEREYIDVTGVHPWTKRYNPDRRRSHAGGVGGSRRQHPGLVIPHPRLHGTALRGTIPDQPKQCGPTSGRGGVSSG